MTRHDTRSSICLGDTVLRYIFGSYDFYGVFDLLIRGVIASKVLSCPKLCQFVYCEAYTVKRKWRPRCCPAFLDTEVVYN